MKNYEIWPDDRGVHINAHGGCILKHGDLFYWYGEHKIEGREGNYAWRGVHAYSSPDLKSWRDEGLAFDLAGNAAPGLTPGQCIVERPKVVFCRKTGKFVLWFHVERSRRYSDAALGVALADSPTGPFRFLDVVRPSRGVWPENATDEIRDPEIIALAKRENASLPNWRDQEELRPAYKGVVGADLESGQQSRDMTVFVDDDGSAWLIHSSEHNSTLHFVELNDECVGFTGRWFRAFEWRWMEAPVFFKRNGKYFMIASGCTGWAPNAARSAVADSISGPWRELGNPAVDEGGDTTYGAQSAFALKLSEDEILFMADVWRPDNAIDGRYLWLPVEWDGERPILRKRAEWDEIWK